MKNIFLSILVIIVLTIVPTILLMSQFFEKPGPLVLVGGGPIPEDAINWLKQKALNINYVVITCDTEIKPDNRWKKMLKNVIFILPEEFDKSHLVNTGAIVIDGGDQWQYVNRLNGTIIYLAHKMGIPILGTSAGAMILGEFYFSAEFGTITSDEINKNDDKIRIGRKFTTIPWLTGILVDTHFSERKRHGRMIAFLSKSKANFGIGIDESTALCISNTEALVLGKGNVKLISRNEKYTVFSQNSLNHAFHSQQNIVSQ